MGGERSPERQHDRTGRSGAAGVARRRTGAAAIPGLTGARPGLHTDGLPPEPGLAVSLSLYPVDEDPVLNDVVVGLQTVSRGEPADRWQAADLDDALFVELEGAHDLVWGGIPILLVQRRSGTSLGQDGNRRWEQVSNYWVTTTRPTPNRVD